MSMAEVEEPGSTAGEPKVSRGVTEGELVCRMKDAKCCCLQQEDVEVWQEGSWNLEGGRGLESQGQYGVELQQSLALSVIHHAGTLQKDTQQPLGIRIDTGGVRQLAST